MSEVERDNGPNERDNNNNPRNAVVVESEMVMELDERKKGADNNQPEAEYDYELITNMNEYLIEEMGEHKRRDSAEYVLYKEVFLRVMGM